MYKMQFLCVKNMYTKQQWVYVLVKKKTKPICIKRKIGIFFVIWIMYLYITYNAIKLVEEFLFLLWLRCNGNVINNYMVKMTNNNHYIMCIHIWSLLQFAFTIWFIRQGKSKIFILCCIFYGRIDGEMWKYAICNL